MGNTGTPPLWRVITDAADSVPLIGGLIGGGESYLRRMKAAEIRAVAQYLRDHGFVSASGGKSTPGSDARLLEALEAEAKRAEAGDE